MHFEAESFDEIYPKLIRGVLDYGQKSSPRGMPITEILGASFTISNSLKGTCLNKNRKIPRAFSIIEKLDYMSGTSDVDRLCFYNENYRQFTKDGVDEGAYGPRLARQYGYVYNLLKKDPDTRQAIFNINNEGDKVEGQQVPCTISLQLILRDGKLNMIAVMRSNDCMYGTPLDVSGFTSVQEMIASWLGVRVGWYKHFAGSLHIYESTKPKLIEILEKPFEKSNYTRPIWNLGYHETKFHFERFFEIEKKLRTGERVEEIEIIKLSYCLRTDLEVVKKFIEKKGIKSEIVPALA